jgi:hypothetical protein
MQQLKAIVKLIGTKRSRQSSVDQMPENVSNFFHDFMVLFIP